MKPERITCIIRVSFETKLFISPVGNISLSSIIIDFHVLNI